MPEKSIVEAPFQRIWVLAVGTLSEPPSSIRHQPKKTPPTPTISTPTTVNDCLPSQHPTTTTTIAHQFACSPASPTPAATSSLSPPTPSSTAPPPPPPPIVSLAISNFSPGLLLAAKQHPPTPHPDETAYSDPPTPRRDSNPRSQSAQTSTSWPSPSWISRWGDGFPGGRWGRRDRAQAEECVGCRDGGGHADDGVGGDVEGYVLSWWG